MREPQLLQRFKSTNRAPMPSIVAMYILVPGIATSSRRDTADQVCHRLPHHLLGCAPHQLRRRAGALHHHAAAVHDHQKLIDSHRDHPSFILTPPADSSPAAHERLNMR